MPLKKLYYALPKSTPTKHAYMIDILHMIISPHMHFFMTHLSMNENTYSIGDVRYLSLQNEMHF
jgi:hypothetical protein